MAAPLILLVHDDRARLEALRQALIDEGYQVEVARSGAVRAVAKRTQPSLILLGIVLPATAGKEACTRLRGDPATRAIPVVGMTAGPKEELADVPVTEWLTEPYGPDELRAVVARWTAVT